MIVCFRKIVCFRLRNPESGLSAFFGIIRFRRDLDWPNLNGGASFWWSFRPNSAWDSIESTTILTTHPSLHKSEKNIWMSVKPCVFSGPCITSGPWIPIFWPVRGFLYADRSVEPYISEWSLYSDRSMDSYILAGPGIPIFWTVHGFLYSGQSMDPYILQNCII